MNTSKAIHTNSDWESMVNSIVGNKIVSLEMCDFFLGKLLGYGVSRCVFEYSFDKRFVVKIDLSDYNANVIEANIWQHVARIPKLSKWFAPVGMLSRCGRIMFQRKCNTKTEVSKYPKNIPDFFRDVKYSNWGLLGDRVVCFDYSHVSITQLGDNKMVKANFV